MHNMNIVVLKGYYFELLLLKWPLNMAPTRNSPHSKHDTKNPHSQILSLASYKTQGTPNYWWTKQIQNTKKCLTNIQFLN